MEKLPLVEGVLKYIEADNALFCVPGHKGGKGFYSTIIGKQIQDNLLKIDLTEVDGMDNLHHPEGIIKDAEELLKELYGSEKSYFLVNGSTSGNLAMIFSAFEEGDKVIVERNCHKSIFNGVLMHKLNPIYLKNKISKELDTPLSIDEEYFLDVLDNNKDARGIIITYPNYYGICCNLEFIIKEVKKRGMKILVDSAHGAHFGINEKLPKSAVDLGADMVVMSAHKTLPSLTQTAFLHVNDKNLIEKADYYMSIFTSTSPSYILMCSLDYARYFLQEEGEIAYNELLALCDKYSKKINNVKGFHVINKDDLHKEAFNIDLTRFVINLDKGLSAKKFNEYLIEKKIQSEMCVGRDIVFIFSPFNKEEDFEKLYNAIIDCSLTFLKEKHKIIPEMIQPKSIMKPYQVIGKITEVINYKLSEGKVSAAAIIPYPPGIPIIMPGEEINIKVIETIEYFLRNNFTILGINDGKIKVVK